jgi:hypothetical protein
VEKRGSLNFFTCSFPIERDNKSSQVAPTFHARRPFSEGQTLFFKMMGQIALNQHIFYEVFNLSLFSCRKLNLILKGNNFYPHNIYKTQHVRW